MPKSNIHSQMQQQLISELVVSDNTKQIEQWISHNLTHEYSNF